MTIINSTNYIASYPWKAIDEASVGLLLECADEAFKDTKLNTLIKALDCFCHLTGKRIKYSTLSSKEFKDIIRIFIGALYSDNFIVGTSESKVRYVRLLIVLLQKVSNRIPSIDYVDGIKKESVNKKFLIDEWNEQNQIFKKELIQYWSGWAITTRKGKEHYLELHRIQDAYGVKFAKEMHKALKAFYLKQARPNFSEVNSLCRFLSREDNDYPAESFYDPTAISILIKEFFKWHFLKCHNRGLDLFSKIKSWNSFVSNIEEAFVDTGIWAKPFVEGFPRPSEKSVKGGQRRIKTTKEGVVVKDKLLTLVPLHVTDEVAVEILFKQVSEDILLVKRWAKREAHNLSRWVKLRAVLAKGGTPIEAGKIGVKHFNDICKKDLCSTFEEFGFITGKERNRVYGWKSQVTDLTEVFGLPTTYSLIPFMFLLVIEHPEITSAFLSEFELYDKNGRLTGFIKQDNYYQLTGYKDRKTKNKSQQKIKLTPRAAVYVKQIIEITSPLRKYLKDRNNSDWKMLFLTCGQGFSKPKSGMIPRFNKGNLDNKPNVRERLLDSFGALCNRSENELLEFLYRINLSSIRASRGVEIYLEKKSVQEMAEALGHTKYDANLLSHYLPEPILGFFQTRWIRIFQKALVCEAMKDSPYMLEATKFESMNELHAFLSNHAIKDIPTHLSNPDNNASTEPKVGNNSYIMISVDTGILSALLSLEEAVNSSSDRSRLCARALYWSDVSSFISSEIESGSDPLLKNHLEQARQHVYADKMEEFIYAAS